MNTNPTFSSITSQGFSSGNTGMNQGTFGFNPQPSNQLEGQMGNQQGGFSTGGTTFQKQSGQGGLFNQGQSNTLFNKPMTTSNTGASNLTFGQDGKMQTNITGQQTGNLGQTNLFGGQQQQNLNLGFNQGQPTTGSFGQNINPPVQNPLQTAQNYSLQSNLSLFQQNQYQRSKTSNVQEVIDVVQNYINAMSPGNPANLFKKMLYNRIPIGGENLLPTFQTYKPTILKDEQQYPIDFNLWQQAMRDNPSKSKNYPFPIFSPAELKERCKYDEFLHCQALHALTSLENQLITINSQFNDISQECSNFYKKREIIRTKQLKVNSNIEKFAFAVGKAEIKFETENEIRNIIKRIQTELNEDKEYIPKLINLKNSAQSVEPNSAPIEPDYLKDKDEKRIEKNMNTIRDMKKILDVTFKSLRNNNNMLEYMNMDILEKQKVGRLNKFQFNY